MTVTRIDRLARFASIRQIVAPGRIVAQSYAQVIGSRLFNAFRSSLGRTVGTRTPDWMSSLIIWCSGHLSGGSHFHVGAAGTEGVATISTALTWHK